MSTKPLEGYRILIFVGDDYEDLELWYPKLRLEEAGAHVTLAGEEREKQYSGKHGYPAVSDGLIAEMEEADFHGVVCAGGWMPDKLRRNPKVLSLLKQFHASQKMIAAICHGGWMPISAGIYHGAAVTGSPGIKDDLINAGAKWEDKSVVVDRHFVSSRRPGDLPDFCIGMLHVLQDQPIA
ncbi:MAG: type 1 glutamine amidotransferase [Planctomycetaceae bacterium]|nr:type 1 glutamine amidotransferase [Planctomycetaceae bacterium]